MQKNVSLGNVLEKFNHKNSSLIKQHNWLPHKERILMIWKTCDEYLWVNCIVEHTQKGHDLRTLPELLEKEKDKSKKLFKGSNNVLNKLETISNYWGQSNAFLQQIYEKVNTKIHNKINEITINSF